MLDQQLPTAVGLGDRQGGLAAREWLSGQDLVGAIRWRLTGVEPAGARGTRRGYEAVHTHGEQARGGVWIGINSGCPGSVGLKDNLLWIARSDHQQFVFGLAALREQTAGQVGKKFAPEIVAVKLDHSPSKWARRRPSGGLTAPKTSLLGAGGSPKQVRRAERFPYRRHVDRI